MQVHICISINVWIQIKTCLRLINFAKDYDNYLGNWGIYKRFFFSYSAANIVTFLNLH